MNILYFAMKNRTSALALEQRLMSECGLGENNICRTIEDLRKKLAGPVPHRPIAVLFLGPGEIEPILNLKYLLEKSCVLIVLDQADEDFVPGAYSLHPRFLAHAENGFNDLVAVIKYMVEKGQFQK